MQLTSSSYSPANQQVLLGPAHVNWKSSFLIIFLLEYELLNHDAVSGWRSIQQEVNHAGTAADSCGAEGNLGSDGPTQKMALSSFKNMFGLVLGFFSGVSFLLVCVCCLVLCLFWWVSFKFISIYIDEQRCGERKNHTGVDMEFSK